MDKPKLNPCFVFEILVVLQNPGTGTSSSISKQEGSKHGESKQGTMSDEKQLKEVKEARKGKKAKKVKKSQQKSEQSEQSGFLLSEEQPGIKSQSDLIEMAFAGVVSCAIS